MSHDASLNFDWAHRAYDSYCASLPPEVSKQLRKPAGEAFVVLYGPTQVGKTTLILTMLQLSEDGHARVGKTLRGKRQIGESSTALATQYRRSKDENWYLSWQGGDITATSDNEMETKLEQLRCSMMEGAIEASDDYCKIDIPRSYFKSQAREGLHKEIRILDLPGVEADNAQEKEYVRAISRKFVPIATLTLLVSKADDLGFFFKGLESIPEIKNWTNTPSRFRIVTTYSFTPESVRKTVKEKQGDIKAYQYDTIAQIGTFGALPERAQEEDLYYPLEFGASWQESNLRKDTPALDEMIQQEFRRLYKDIATADDPLNYLFGVLDSQNCAELFYYERLEMLNNNINALRKKLEDRKNILASLNEKLEEVKIHVKRGEQELHALQLLSKDDGPIGIFWVAYKKCQELHQKAIFDLLQTKQWSVAELKSFTSLCTIGKTTTKPEDELALLPWIIYHYDDWLYSQQEVFEGAGEGDEKISYNVYSRFLNSLPSAEDLLRDGPSFIRSNFKEIREKLDGYWINSYWSDESYQEDCRMFMLAYKRSASKIQEIIRQSLDIEQKRRKEKTRKKKEQADSELKTLERQKLNREFELRLLEQQREESEAQREQVEVECEETKTKTDNMRFFFLKEYFKEISNAYEAVFTTQGAGASLQKLCQARTLEESRKIIEQKIFHK